MKQRHFSSCAGCEIPMAEKTCTQPEGKCAKGCPTLTRKELRDYALREYLKAENLEFTRQASIQEAECYAGRERKPFVMHPTKPRIIEICEFASKMGYSRLGLIFCGGLAKEAEVVDRIFKKQGFEVVSVMCKAGSIPKEEIGLEEDQKMFIGEYDVMCNPIFQAAIVNEAKTHFNVTLGQCVGHDSLFFKYAKAPTTVLAVKDRVTGHNPLAAIYLTESYYGRLLPADNETQGTCRETGDLEGGADPDPEAEA